MAASASVGAPRVDEANQCIWYGERRVDLTPKAFIVLRRLLQQPSQIVTKRELLDAAWPDTHVSEGVLTLAINQLREAFGDDARQPRFIETVHRRGYRWIGGSPAGAGSAVPAPEAPPEALHSAPGCVGREASLQQLEQALARAAAGSRQMLFVTGEPGIGKTTLIDHFLAGLGRHTAADPRSRGTLLARGQCVGGYGASEAYMPLLEAVERLCHESTSAAPVDQLRRAAPTWLLQLPRLLLAGEQDELRRVLAGSGSERMVRELLGFVAELAADHTVLLVLEDLHWSDHATVGALAALAMSRQPARLLVIASYRPADAIGLQHPVTSLKHELTTKGQCVTIALDGLTTDAIATYLDHRFPRHRLPPELAPQLRVNTSGNPLFLLNAIDDFVQRGWLAERDGVWACTVDLAALAAAVPDGSRQMIGFRLQQLPAADHELLETASVVGQTFATQTLAAALERPPAEIEVACARLAHTAQFERAGAIERAVSYRMQAARQGVSRYAYDQAIAELHCARELLRGIPTGASRHSLELSVHLALLRPMFATLSLGSTDLLQVIERIQSLSREEETTTELLEALAMLVLHHVMHDLKPARAAAEEMLARAEDVPWREVAERVARMMLGLCQVLQGELGAAVTNLETAIDLPDLTPAVALDPGIIATTNAALGSCLLGHPSKARDLALAAIQRAQASGHPPTFVQAVLGGIRIGVLTRDDECLTYSAALVASIPEALAPWRPWAEIAHGWLDACRGNGAGVDRMLSAVDDLARAQVPYFRNLYGLMLITGLVDCRRYEEAEARIAAELPRLHAEGAFWWEPELHRLRGEILSAGRAELPASRKRSRELAAEAEACFRHAIDVARGQAARWWELRAAVSLARLVSDGDGAAEARDLLRGVYDQFSEGCELPDLRAAQQVLEA